MPTRLTEGSTVNMLKRGGQTQRVTQSIRIGNGLCDCQKVCKCKQKTKRRKAKKNVPQSTFFPNQPVRLIPPQFQLAQGVGLRYANQPVVSIGVGNNPIQNGSNAYTAGAPNAANQGQYGSLPALNQLEDMYRQGYVSQRLIPTMDMNAPRNAALVSGNLPPVKSDPEIGGTGPRSESQTSKAIVPESRTTHLHNVAAIASARNMGQDPVNAMAAAAAASSGISQLRSAHSAGMKAYFNELKDGQSVEEVPAASSKSGKRETRILYPNPGGQSRLKIVEEEMRRGGRKFM